MSRAQFAAVRKVVGSDDVTILAVGPDETHVRFVGGDMTLPIWYAADAFEPQVGDRLATWVDVSTRYVMAARR